VDKTKLSEADICDKFITPAVTHSGWLTAEFGKGYSVANLRNFRQFFQTFSAEEIRYTPGSELSWSHYTLVRLLPQVDAGSPTSAWCWLAPGRVSSNSA